MPANLVPVITIVVIVVAVFLVLRSVFALYVKVSPNKAAVFYGRKSRTTEGKITGAKIVSGGGKFRVPLIEAVSWLDLGSIPIDLKVDNIPNIDGVAITVLGVATVKIKSEEAALAAAAERFLGKEPQEIKNIVYENLIGHLRAITGRMHVEELIRDRQRFNEEVLKEATEDLAKMGVQVDLLKIQDIKDPVGYIEAMGKPQTAIVKRDAQMAEATAKSEGDQKTAIANQEARTVEAQRAADIALAEKERDVKKAQYNAQVNAERATAEQAGPLATAKATQEVVTQETVLAKNRAERREAELLAEVIKPADAARGKTVIDADASRQQTVIAAEASKEQQRLEGEGEGAKMRAVGEGEAAKIRAVGEAEGAAIKAKLLGEAEGIREKAKAWKEMDEAGKIMFILEKLPEVLKSIAPIASALAAPMGNIDKVTIVDVGGNGEAPARFAGNATKVLASLVEPLKETGVIGALKGLLFGGSAPEESEPQKKLEIHKEAPEEETPKADKNS